MAHLYPDVPESKRYSEKEFGKIVDIVARILHGDNELAHVSEVAGTYQDSLEFVKICHDKPHKKFIQSLMKGEYPLPERGEIESYKEYEQYLNEASDLRGELRDLRKVKVIVKGKLNPLFVKNYDYIQKIDPDKFEGSVQQERVNGARRSDEIARKIRPKPEDLLKRFD